MTQPAEVIPVGDAAVLVALGDQVHDATLARVWSLFAQLRNELGGSVLDIVPAFSSILIRFDPSAVRLAAIMASARGVVEHCKTAVPGAGRTVHINVCFAQQYALDLKEVAASAGRSEDDVIREFCAPTYRVAFLGFTAGFPYLVGLPDVLRVPRLGTPRLRVPAGSVAIAGTQCGIYPCSSPGGWRIVGRTAAPIFDPKREPAALFAPADCVRFHPVDSLAAASASIAS
jgi:KipI family sensor histidine kinase inhibitor